MSIKEEYFQYLRHFRKTVSLREFHAQSWRANLIGLRHDVDHDLDIALEMSFWEKEMGFQATYFLLPTAEYWNQKKLLDKALQMQDFGHEVGLHLNVITEWLDGEISDPLKRTGEVLEFLRQSGLHIQGVSSHGDRLCYEKNFINYWLFSELRPQDPVETETGLNAEGIPAAGNEHRIIYPESHTLNREDGQKLSLWSVPMERLNLAYESLHLPFDRYFTDSHGGWKRSPDPLDKDLTTGRHQILIHPINWRGSQKIYFFLSTARSGSKWLANIMDKATPVATRHEFTLNHCYQDGEWREEHHTGPGFTSLIRDKEKVRQLILDSRTWIEEGERDFAEANVYLEQFLPLMLDIFPDAVFVHLHRNPADVVRSIINRDWYDTPQDDRHPVIDVPGWSQMSQFEKACWYVRATNENLLHLGVRLRFEDMVSEISYFEKFLRALNIPFYPRFVKNGYADKVNANLNNDFPRYEAWPEELKAVFQRICNSVNSILGYASESGFPEGSSSDEDKASYHFEILGKPTSNTRLETLMDIDLRHRGFSSHFSHAGCSVQETKEGLELIPKKGRHAYLLIGGGTWDTVTKKAGWEPKIGHYYQGRINVRVDDGGLARLFCLMYDQNGTLMSKRLLKKITGGEDKVEFSFRVRSNASRFNLALHMHKDYLPAKLMIAEFSLQVHVFESDGLR
jgi:hypothetical protein